jgi:hypothetical protein
LFIIISLKIRNTIKTQQMKSKSYNFTILVINSSFRVLLKLESLILQVDFTKILLVKIMIQHWKVLLPNLLFLMEKNSWLLLQTQLVFWNLNRTIRFYHFKPSMDVSKTRIYFCFWYYKIINILRGNYETLVNQKVKTTKTSSLCISW